jgi:hypothetical protein
VSAGPLAVVVPLTVWPFALMTVIEAGVTEAGSSDWLKTACTPVERLMPTAPLFVTRLMPPCGPLTVTVCSTGGWKAKVSPTGTIALGSGLTVAV